MDDAALMRRFEGVRDLRRNRQRLVEGKRSVGDTLGERPAFDQLQYQRPHAVGFFETVDRADVRMIQRREDLCFPLKTRETIGIIGEEVGKDLDRDVTLQLRVSRAIDLPHAAGPKGGEDFVRAEAGTGGEGTNCWIICAGWITSPVLSASKHLLHVRRR